MSIILCCTISPARTIPDPEFPGDEEYLYFVLVEFNVEDIKELRRITALELQGSLDADGLKAFVEKIQEICPPPIPLDSVQAQVNWHQCSMQVAS